MQVTKQIPTSVHVRVYTCIYIYIFSGETIVCEFICTVLFGMISTDVSKFYLGGCIVLFEFGLSLGQRGFIVMLYYSPCLLPSWQ